MDKRTFESTNETPNHFPLPDDLKKAIQFAARITQDLLIESKRASERLDLLVREAASAGASARTIRIDAGISSDVVERIVAGTASWRIFTESSAS